MLKKYTTMALLTFVMLGCANVEQQEQWAQVNEIHQQDEEKKISFYLLGVDKKHYQEKQVEPGMRLLYIGGIQKELNSDKTSLSMHSIVANLQAGVDYQIKHHIEDNTVKVWLENGTTNKMVSTYSLVEMSISENKEMDEHIDEYMVVKGRPIMKFSMEYNKRIFRENYRGFEGSLAGERWPERCDEKAVCGL